MLEFQRDISLRIAEQIRHTLSPARLDALARRHSGNSEAFQLYLQGLKLWNQLTPQTTRRAIEYYTRATERDPEYALATGMALAYAGAPINGDADPRVMAPLARRAADRAMAADPRLAEAQTAMGAVKFWFDWDWRAAETMFRSAVTTDPNYAFGQRMIGILLSHQARHSDARAEMRRLLKLEPTYEMNWALSAQVAFNAGEYPAAFEFAKQASSFWVGDYQLAMTYEQMGKDDLALQTIANALSASAANSKLHALRGYIFAKTRRQPDVRNVLRTLEEMSHQRYVPPYARALVHAGLGERREALEWLQRAFDERDVHLIALPTDPKWNAFRGDARFIALLKSCGFTAS